MGQAAADAAQREEVGSAVEVEQAAAHRRDPVAGTGGCLRSANATAAAGAGRLATTLAGKLAAGSTQRRKTSVFYNALELGRLGSNLVDRIQWTAPAVAASVDRRVVVSPAQAGALLTAAGPLGQRGAAPEGVLRRALPRGAAPVGGGDAARGRPAPGEPLAGLCVGTPARHGRAATASGVMCRDPASALGGCGIPARLSGAGHA